MRIRERRAEDLPALEAVLADQQPSSGYPHHWPLPFPVRDFLVRRTEQRAWVAEDGDLLVGHVAVARPDESVHGAFAAALGTDDFGALTALFVATDVLGRGVGGRLIDTAVEWTRAAGQEQEQGIAQVNQAVIEMDGVTQQNAALVEEAAAAASAMQEQTTALLGLVGKFTLSSTALPAVAIVCTSHSN